MLEGAILQILSFQNTVDVYRIVTMKILSLVITCLCSANKVCDVLPSKPDLIMQKL